MPLKNITSTTQNAKILFATDEWFACAHNLLKPTPPTFDPTAYCPEGKVMDGWETRRKRIPGHDWCVVRLDNNEPTGRISEIEIDTAFFTGNYTPKISVWGSRGGDELMTVRNEHLGTQGTCASEEEVREAERVCAGYEWVEILAKTELKAGYEATRRHKFEVVGGSVPDGLKYVRLNYYPDGGVARLKIWAEVDDRRGSGTPLSSAPSIDFAAWENGGVGIGCSNRHYGEPSNLLKAGSGKDMSDGWETARHTCRPEVLKLIPGTDLVNFGDLTDWVVIELGGVAENGVEKIIIDTAHFKGNYPESVRVEGCYQDGGRDDAFLCRPLGEDEQVGWFPLLNRSRVSAHSQHTFEKDIVNTGKKVSHVRVTIYPDGGISRVRIFGKGLCKRRTSFQRSNL